MSVDHTSCTESPEPSACDRRQGAVGAAGRRAARILGFPGMAAAALAVMRAAAARHAGEPETTRTLTALAVALLLVVSGPIAGWSYGGLEPPYLAALLAAASVVFETLFVA